MNAHATDYNSLYNIFTSIVHSGLELHTHSYIGPLQNNYFLQHV